MGHPTPPTRPPRAPRSTPPTLTYRAAQLPSGALLPIEVRLGRRVLRTVAPDGAEGRALLRTGKVEIVVASDN